MDYFYKQPKYFREFKCIGGDCPKSCCDGWNVSWKDEELIKLKSADSSAELKEKINNSFIRDNEDKYNIVKMCDDGRCPFHDRETDLCQIQREIGEKYLGHVCTIYPRQFIQRDSMILRWCVSSCPAVLDLLFEDEDSVNLENVVARNYKTLNKSSVKIDDMNAMRFAPIKVYRFDLLDFYTEILLDKNRDLDISVILVALAAKHLTDAETKGEYKKIPQIIHDLRPQLKNPATAKSLEEIKPNYQLKFKLINNMIVKFFEERHEIVDLFSIHDGNELVMDNYHTGINNFNNAFDNKPYILRNVIINTFYDLEMPLGKIRKSLFENFAFFALAAATIKFVAAGVGFKSNNIKEDFKLCVAELSRSFAHNPIKSNHMIDEMKELGLTSPAHLALIIKG